MKALVTGISGFVGSHMAEFLLRQGAEVVGTIRNRSRMDHIAHLTKDVRLSECELRDPFSVETLSRAGEAGFDFPSCRPELRADVMEFPDRYDP